MPDEPTQGAGADAGGTGTAAPTSATQPQTDWESQANPYRTRFTGLQGKYQQEKEKWTGDLQTVNTKLFDANEALTKLSGEHAALKTQFDALGVKKGERDDAYGVMEEKLGRLTTIATEFPDLLPFYKDGLLPEGTGDDLKTKLAAFRARLGDLGKQQAADALAGASPTAPTPQPPKSSSDLWEQAKKALSEGKLDEYQKLYDEYVKATPKK